MSIETNQLNHPKSIWYWIGSERLWYLPYASSPVQVKHGFWSINAGGTDVLLELKKTRHILFYGANKNTGSLPIDFLSECAHFRVGISVHRNHVAEPMVFYPMVTSDRNDLLSQQILHRADAKKTAYIARTLVRWQWQQREWLCPSIIDSSRLAQCRQREAVMLLEAQAASNYWLIFYRKLGLGKLTRRAEHPVNSALNATSHFLSGITLRWIVSHGLSPSHGYLHSSTAYPALVYDLMEITRWITEKAVFEVYLENPDDLKDLTERSILRFKALLDEKINTEPTRQVVYRRSLIQGNVIALRHYLENRMKNYLPAVEEEQKKRGRKRLVSYVLTGEIWQ